ncbi:hypothetical protein VE03_04989 [Pseudogymnoascus sp. 23342-1-I1]|nr:hypothetical protein VE03_04989 [Pseudogymnoascus sp. 23342-1-I1]
MAIVYRTNSTKQRMEKKKSNPRPRKAKFPKDALKAKDGSRKVISGPSNPVLGTAHANNRFNEIFDVDPENLPRSESLPHLNQWITEALAAIAYNSTRAHQLTKRIVYPQKGWIRFKQRLGLRATGVLTHILRNVANMFKRLRDKYMNAETPIVDCLEESDLLWQNILEPITGVAQIMCEVIFRGHTNLEIHKIDGLKLARSLRILGEELKLTAVMLDSMIGHIATKWTDRTVLMAIDTAKGWRVATIKRMGLEGIYDEDGDSENDDVKNTKRAKLLEELIAPQLPQEAQGSPEEGTPSETLKKGGPQVKEQGKPPVQTKDIATPNNPNNNGLALKKAPKVPRPRGPSVFLPQPPDPYEEIDKAREKEYQDRQDQEDSDRYHFRTAMENLPDDDEFSHVQPTRPRRTYAAAKKDHYGLLMDDQDMEMDPLRLAQLRGVTKSSYIPSYATFPSAHLTDNRGWSEEAPPQEPDRHVKKDKGKGVDYGKEDKGKKIEKAKAEKGKEVERRPVLKKPKAEVPEATYDDVKLTPQLSGPEEEVVENSEVHVHRKKSSDNIVTQEKDHHKADGERPVKQLGPPSGKDTAESKIARRAQHYKEIAEALARAKKEEESTPPTLSEENRRTIVRFAEPTAEVQQPSSKIKAAETTSKRMSEEANSSRARTVGDSLRSRSGRRANTGRNPGEPSPSNTGRPFPIPVRVGEEVMPAPPKMRPARSHDTLDNRSVDSRSVDNRSVGFARDSSLMPAPLRLGQKQSNSLVENRGFESSLMPAPLKLVRSASRSPLENYTSGFPERSSLVPAPLKISRSESKSPLENESVPTFEGTGLMPPPSNPRHMRSTSPLNESVAIFEGTDLMPPPSRPRHMRSRSPLENRAVGSQGGPSHFTPSTSGLSGGFSMLTLSSFAEDGSLPVGPPPDRPLPPIPKSRE